MTRFRGRSKTQVSLKIDHFIAFLVCFSFIYLTHTMSAIPCVILPHVRIVKREKLRKDGTCW